MQSGTYRRSDQRGWYMIKDFKAFLNQGNVMGLAVGVIIGAAFSKIVDSVVNDLIMPLLWRSRWLQSAVGTDVAQLVLWLRRVTIGLLALLAQQAQHRADGGAGQSSERDGWAESRSGRCAD